MFLVCKYTIRGSYIAPNPVSGIGRKFKRVDLGQHQTFGRRLCKGCSFFSYSHDLQLVFGDLLLKYSWHVTISIRFTKCSNIFTTNTNPNHHSSNKSSCCLAGGLSTNGKCHGSRGSALGRRGANPFRPHGRSGWSKSQDQNFSLYHGRPFPCVCYTTCYSTRSFSGSEKLEISSLQQPGGMNTKNIWKYDHYSLLVLSCTNSHLFPWLIHY